jgi:hypothetical protein
MMRELPYVLPEKAVSNGQMVGAGENRLLSGLDEGKAVVGEQGKKIKWRWLVKSAESNRKTRPSGAWTAFSELLQAWQLIRFLACIQVSLSACQLESRSELIPHSFLWGSERSE